MEETGLKVFPEKLIRKGSPVLFDRYLVTVFMTDVYENTFSTNNEVSETAWCNYNNRPDTKLLTEDIFQAFLSE